MESKRDNILINGHLFTKQKSDIKEEENIIEKNENEIDIKEEENIIEKNENEIDIKEQENIIEKNENEIDIKEQENIIEKNENEIDIKEEENFNISDNEIKKEQPKETDFTLFMYQFQPGSTQEHPEVQEITHGTLGWKYPYSVPSQYQFEVLNQYADAILNKEEICIDEKKSIPVFKLFADLDIKSKKKIIPIE